MLLSTRSTNTRSRKVHWGCVLLLLLSTTLVATADLVLYLPFEDTESPIDTSADSTTVVVHDDPAAATIDTWTQWVIPLRAFADQGIDLTNVDRIAIGLGTHGNMTIPGGSGKIFIDDIRLYRSRETLPASYCKFLISVSDHIGFKDFIKI